ncbi:GlcG/HbpS family heme-binding protein [Acidiphilium iwatense]|uniref:Heme-binding protein n=1 Tax=Acidiphilium iwatense TaxID=768198 RepID=A0ABS9DTY7_9PROT|nr:heme-binding protein [Acidiphilium iwatense]MCF3945618.1 heme-binding protein [Acidiphilium iwatense]
MDRLDVRTARTLATAAIETAHAEYRQRPICVAVCDADGTLIAFLRADGAPLRSIDIAQGKAYSAARMGVSTAAFLERIHREHIQPGYFCDARLTALPGGNVIRNANGNIIGAIGISGLTSREDQAIADRLAEAMTTGSIRAD